MSQVFSPIAHIYTDFPEKFGIPRQSGLVPSLAGRIVFLPAYRNPDALREITGFSHLWLLFDFSKSHRTMFTPTVRPPRLGGNRRVGVFASRSPFRPNAIGLSCVMLDKAEETQTEGTVLYVSGADLLNGTPIYDIKPYLPYADAYPHAKCGYAADESAHRLSVDIPSVLLEKFSPHKREAICACLAADPRPGYQDDPTRVYRMRFGDRELHFTVQDNTVHVIEVL